MSYLQQVQAAVDFIEQNLDDELSLASVSAQAGLSQWHFQRIFKALSNETLKSYIRSRRLAEALRRLTHTDERIIDIALVAGFESQESFSRAFKNAFGMTPHESRKRDARNFLFRKVEIDAGYLQHIHRNVSLEPEVYLQPARLFVGLHTTFYSVDSEKNNIADRLPALWDEFVPRMADIKNAVPGMAYGVVRQTEEKTDLLQYLAACEVPDKRAVPEGMRLIEIPETRYARFRHAGNTQKLDTTVNYVYSSWLLQSDHQHSYCADIEEYGQGFIPDSEDSVIFYHIPLSA